jgi:pyruvate dehydrogenase E2 component (dihydrolipoamide acetyltransferase)
VTGSKGFKLGDKISEGTLLMVLEAAGEAAQPASAPSSKENQPLAQEQPAQAAA